MFKIDKEASDPGSEMLFEEFTISLGRSCKSSRDKIRHDFA